MRIVFDVAGLRVVEYGFGHLTAWFEGRMVVDTYHRGGDIIAVHDLRKGGHPTIVRGEDAAIQLVEKLARALG